MPQWVDLLFDSSALVKYYHEENGTDTVRYWIDKLTQATATPRGRCFVPHICIPEVLTAFYSMRYIGHKDDKFTDRQLKERVATFLDDVRRRKLHPVNVTRVHIIETEKVYRPAMEQFLAAKKAAKKTQTKPRIRRLGPIDIMVVAVGLVFEQKHPKMWLVTSDGQMMGVARRLSLPSVDPADDATIPRGLRPSL